MNDHGYHQTLKETKRKAIVCAAVELFLEQGYERTSLQQIGKRADVSTATLFKRFPTKAALFEAMIEDFWAVPPPCPEKALSEDPAIGLRFMGVGYAMLLRSPDMQAVYRLIIAEAPRFPDLGHMVYGKAKGPFLARLEEYLRIQADAGRVKIDDFAKVANQFLAVITGQVFWPELIGVGCGGRDEDVGEIVEEAVSLILAKYAT
ncbi:TetR/AcrR family transcriptional regulator [Pseudomonas tolaasii]|uniref:TetR/AcrR family transcriptional regulator n=1 Tax=Pseudomonas tolaasii TaxID=29442 RepID=UPI0015A4178B|nr:TetR/AcrR family transcriptional regulator [Pseudomonas tolaasii]NWC27235.1 TetR/AcrR family transcriptional regulator [Pseudomonas tolaasii]NWC54240.1 TetR/AcrR family transcriptional regulator [Pseudomonas tolaasii]NWE61528.1 TetR/AcrR family transcriptional regulator [Pseudomonas tolaasii]